MTGIVPTEQNRLFTLRLLVSSVDGESSEGELRLRTAVADVLGTDDAGQPWRVRRLVVPAPGEDQALARDFVVEGTVAGMVTDPAMQDEAFELALRLQDHGGFDEVEPDLPIAVFEAPDGDAFLDPPHLPESAAHDWARQQIRCAEAWALVPPAGGASRGAGIAIGHPDTGYTLHPALDGALDLVHDWDFVQGDDDARDPMPRISPWPLPNPGHGTGTGSVIVGRKQDERSILGVAPAARLVPIRAVDSVVQFFDSDVARAVHHARNAGCHVISMSLGGKGFFGLRRAIRVAIADGCIVMAAAGNYFGLVTAPASYDECIAVAAVNAREQPWVNSSHGRKVAISAPGESVWVAGWNREVQPHEPHIAQTRGTSHAVAHLAGAAALWLAYHGRDNLIDHYGRNNLQTAFLEALRTAGHRRPNAWDSTSYGVGIVDAEQLLPAKPDLPAGFVEPPVDVPIDPVARIADALTDLDADEVRRRLAAVLRADGPALDELLRRHGAQVYFRLLQHPDVREQFVAEGDGFVDTTDETRSKLASVASPSLEADLVG
jgi:subtilisin family serine protease